MLIDITGIMLTPGNNGEMCLGNGKHFDKDGKLIELCCDECHYALCCMENACKTCKLEKCVKEND